MVAVLALLPPWVLLYLVSGKEGMKGGWPLAVVGSLGYIAGQYPVAVHLGPYLPDITGAIVCFVALFVLLKFWQPKTVLGYGGVPVDAAMAKQTQGHGLQPAEVLQAWMPFIVLLVVVGGLDRSVVALAESELVQRQSGRLLVARGCLRSGKA